MLELKYLKALMLTRQMHQNSALLATVGIFYIRFLNFNWVSLMGVSNGCHEVLMMSMNLNDNAILNIQCWLWLYY